VLFSGTPCQIAALGSFLGNKEFENLLTIDIICHGVPSAKFFEGYIQELEKKLSGKITAFRFRDKTGGWGLKGSVEYINKSGAHKKKIVPVQLSSYYKLFLDSVIYRENCYSCKYAGPFRTGDITIGDYWGIEKEHPEYLVVNGGSMDQRQNLSCVLVNTEKGKKMMEKFGFSIQLKPSSFERAARHNGQLRHPSHRSDKREFIFKLYKEGGYAAVDKWHNKRLGAKKYIYMFWNMLPKGIRSFIKKLG
jgi:coenzyme F420-reducing hydrogenase beta subunit